MNLSPLKRGSTCSTGFAGSWYGWEKNCRAKEKLDEQSLQKASLTREEAIKLYHESASLIRAIMDLRECEAGNVKLKEPDIETRQKIDDAKRWIGFLKNVGKNSG